MDYALLDQKIVDSITQVAKRTLQMSTPHVASTSLEPNMQKLDANESIFDGGKEIDVCRAFRTIFSTKLIDSSNFISKIYERSFDEHFLREIDDIDGDGIEELLAEYNVSESVRTFFPASDVYCGMSDWPILETSTRPFKYAVKLSAGGGFIEVNALAQMAIARP